MDDIEKEMERVSKEPEDSSFEVEINVKVALRKFQYLTYLGTKKIFMDVKKTEIAQKTELKDMNYDELLVTAGLREVAENIIKVAKSGPLINNIMGHA